MSNFNIENSTKPIINKPKNDLTPIIIDFSHSVIVKRLLKESNSILELPLKKLIKKCLFCKLKTKIFKAMY